jgi:predicted DNA-binding protein (MmcQ/YjbR family)
MLLETVRAYCLSKPHVTEEFPFDSTTLVFKVANKMFALLDVDDFSAVVLKCNPEKAIEYRERYTGVRPGYHMNKKHWNSVQANEDVPDSVFFEMIDESYCQVVAGLTKKVRNELALG